MPEKRTVQRAKKDARQGKAPSTQAGEYVREEMDHIRKGKHGARSTKQAIAIGLSKARRAGVKLAPPKKGRTSAATRKKAERDLEVGRKHPQTKGKSNRRSNARQQALKREPRTAASRQALSRHAKQAATARKKRGTVTPQQSGAKKKAARKTTSRRKAA